MKTGFLWGLGFLAAMLAAKTAAGALGLKCCGGPMGGSAPASSGSLGAAAE